jgi:hypothetical protein
MKRIISVDAGRSRVKAVETLGGMPVRKEFLAVLAPAPDRFKLDIKQQDSDLWVNFENEEFLVGDLAIRQSSLGVQERDSNKANKQNRSLIAVACSLFVENGDSITLLTNIPAQQWGLQCERVAEQLKGRYIITHRAGSLKGKRIEFVIDEVFPLPEGESAYFGYIYGSGVRPIHEELLLGNTLVLDIGDQTTNYITMLKRGEPRDDMSGTLPNGGMFSVFEGVRNWLLEQDVNLSIPEVMNSIINREVIYRGSEPIGVSAEFARQCNILAQSIANDIKTKLKTTNFTFYQYILLAGGGGNIMLNALSNNFTLNKVLGDPSGRWWGAEGQRSIYARATSK